MEKIKMVEISEKELQALKRRVAILDELEDKIADTQEEDDADLTTIGEIVLDHLDMWVD